MNEYRIIEGDATERLRELDAASVQTCITSPPYWGLRDYGDENQLGLEPTPEQYVANLVAVFREVRRVLRDDGTLWLNLGDSYNGQGGTGREGNDNKGQWRPAVGSRLTTPTLKQKDLVGIPWMVAFALRADGWWLRSDIVWAKPNPMPESVTDRPTRSHEYLFLLTKSARYFYDADAVREDSQDLVGGGPGTGIKPTFHYGANNGGNEGLSALSTRHRTGQETGRNKRSVWTVATQPFPGAHFATFPPKLIEPCVLAGSPPQCCGHCGAPWERVIEEKVSGDGHLCPQDQQGRDKRAETRRSLSEAADVSSRLHGQYYDISRTTVGWLPSCECGWVGPEDPPTSTVLDPFCGAGTTGVVALRHDRDFVGIELNPEYAQMARDRIRDDAPLFNVEAV